MLRFQHLQLQRLPQDEGAASIPIVVVLAELQTELRLVVLAEAAEAVRIIVSALSPSSIQRSSISAA
jgi:hypothetical protein